MKGDQTNNDNADRAEVGEASPIGQNRQKQSRKSRSAAQKARGEKANPKPKSFLIGFRRLGAEKKALIVIGAVGAFAALAGVGVYAWQTIQQRQIANEQRQPLVINSRPPEMLGTFACSPESGFHAGNMQSFVKNVGNATASHVMPYALMAKVIPEKRTGDRFWDDPPPVDCSTAANANELEHPIAPGIELRPQLRQMAGGLPPQITKESPVQLYMTSCVYYADDYAKRHGTCDTYRLSFKSTNPVDTVWGSPTFFCDGGERRGAFIETVGGHCQQ